MAFTSQLSRPGRAYLRIVAALGFLVIAESLLQLYRDPVEPQWLLLAALTLISGSASVKLPWAHVSISISEAFVFTAVLLYGPSAGTLTVALDGLVISFWIAKRRPEIDRALFNIAAPAASAWCSSHLFFYVSGIAPLVQQPTPVESILPSLVLFALTYFGLNSGLIAIVIAIEKHQNPWNVWRRGFLWLSLNYFCGASVAVLLVGSNRTIDLRFVGLVLPLLLVLYFTFKTSMERVEDANKHVDQLNTLYLSTIETLAMAIDAKDQVTHGHIRRVQSYATRLADAVGVRDERLLKAIEAAALLHDMGKLAVPEYILNKPGKLTEAEFEKMKLHASVGADILSAIDFPYPVVPIVRHHHENWDGTGYPDGLRSTDIPVGARILAVVDCFDALTSDRPYRPRLPDADALRILIERRGSMYDPLIVDAFVRVHQSIAPEPIASGPPPYALDEIASARKNSRLPNTAPVLEEIAASSDEMLTLYELASALAGPMDLADASDLVARHLRRLIPSSLFVLYLFDSSSDEIEARHAVGDGATLVRGTRIRLGQRLSGWVAANRQTICNSDPALDLGDASRSHALNLRSCVSTPLISGDKLVGVLALYSGEVNAFSDDHRRVIEVVARQVAHMFEHTRDFEPTNTRDSLTGLPNFGQLEEFVRTSIGNREHVSNFTLLFIDVVQLNQVKALHGQHAGDEVLHHVVQYTRSALRTEDMLFRYGGDEFVAVLNDTDIEVANKIARRVGESIRENSLLIRTNRITVDVEVTILSVPDEGQSVTDLIAAVRAKTPPRANERDRSTIH